MFLKKKKVKWQYYALLNEATVNRVRANDQSITKMTPKWPSQYYLFDLRDPIQIFTKPWDKIRNLLYFLIIILLY